MKENPTYPEVFWYAGARIGTGNSEYRTESTPLSLFKTKDALIIPERVHP